MALKKGAEMRLFLVILVVLIITTRIALKTHCKNKLDKYSKIAKASWERICYAIVTGAAVPDELVL